jgi:hypothetical protein
MMPLFITLETASSLDSTIPKISGRACWRGRCPMDVVVAELMVVMVAAAGTLVLLFSILFDGRFWRSSIEVA